MPVLSPALTSEHELYMECADIMYNGMILDGLRELQKVISEKIEDTGNYSTIFRRAVNNAISKRLLKKFRALYCTVNLVPYLEYDRMVREGEENPGLSHPNDEDFIRNKHTQMFWLFSERTDYTWLLLGVDDGCDRGPAGLMEEISSERGHKNVRVVRLKETLVEGDCPGLDREKLKSRRAMRATSSWRPARRAA